MNDKKIRVNIFLTQELKEYVMSRSREMGMSYSAFIVMALVHYKQSCEVSSSLVELKQMFDELKSNGLLK